MRLPINKVGNIEIEHNTLKYRIPLNEVTTDDINVLEKNLKRKVQSIEHEPYYLAPFEVQIINGSVIYYYNMVQYKGFDTLRQFPFRDKLKYYVSLVEIAKKIPQTNTLWDRHNFVVDPHEEKLKAIIYESEDVKIHDTKDSFEGIRDLILISLTKLNSIIGKPKRIDFIDQEEEIIQFAETLLSGKIESVEDLGFYLETKQIEYDHEKNDEVQKVDKKVKVNIKNKIKAPKKVKTKTNKSIVKKGVVKKGDKKTNKYIVILGVVVVLAIIVNLAMPKTHEAKIKENKSAKVDTPVAKAEKTKGTVENTVTSEKYNPELLKAYRLSLTGNEDEAIKSLEKIGYKKLGSEDQRILLNLYQKNGELYKVIDIDPSKAKDIVNGLIANGKSNQLSSLQKKMKTHNPYVDFEVAYLEQDWKTIIKLKDEVEINGRKEHQITEAYLNLKQLDKAKKYADSVGDPDLIQMVNDYTVTD